MDVDEHGLEILDRGECLRLLRARTLGRVGITSGALPTVLPVNYQVIDDQVMFRTARGTKLDAATRNAVVAFEIDDMDPMDHTGWSVVVTGIARELDDIESRRVDLPIAHWAPDGADRIVAISTEMISGRRLTGLRVGMDEPT